MDDRTGVRPTPRVRRWWTLKVRQMTESIPGRHVRGLSVPVKRPAPKSGISYCGIIIYPPMILDQPQGDPYCQISEQLLLLNLYLNFIVADGIR